MGVLDFAYGFTDQILAIGLLIAAFGLMMFLASRSSLEYLLSFGVMFLGLILIYYARAISKALVSKPEPKVEAKEEPEFTQTYVEEEEIIRKKKTPVFISKKLPTTCPKCGSPFKGKSGDACEYCGSTIREEDKINKVE